MWCSSCSELGFDVAIGGRVGGCTMWLERWVLRGEHDGWEVGEKGIDGWVVVILRQLQFATHC